MANSEVVNLLMQTFSEPSPSVQQDVLLDTYFVRCHGKSYHIVDESTIRQRVQINQIPTYLLYAIYAVSARYVNTGLIAVVFKSLTLPKVYRTPEWISCRG
jgi:hypothetical protein